MSSTNKTTYYDLPQFVDNDIFNPLVDDNDAYSKIDTALHNIANAEADDASEIVGVKSRLDSAEGDIDALEAQNGNSVLTTTAQTLSGAINELDGDISSLDGRLDIVEDDINNASTGLKAKVGILETKVGSATLDTIADDLSGAVNELLSTINANFNKLNTEKAWVSVKQFGAVGDGVTDDGDAIREALEYCNEHGYGLYFNKGTYLYSFTEPVTIKCDVDFGGSELIISSPEYYSSVFFIGDAGEQIILSQSVFTDNGTVNDSRLYNKAFALVTPMSLGLRYGSSGEEFYKRYVVVDSNGKIVNGAIEPTIITGNYIFNNVRAFDEIPISVKNLKVSTTSNEYLPRLFFIRANNVTVENIVVNYTPIANTEYIYGVIYPQQVCNCHLRNILGVNPYGTAGSGYIIEIATSFNIDVEDIICIDKAGGSWGSIGTNSSDAMHFRNCITQRIDAHECGTYTAENCYLDWANFSGGYGNVIFDNCHFRFKHYDSSAIAFIQNRTDHLWLLSGNLVIKNCVFDNPSGSNKTLVFITMPRISGYVDPSAMNYKGLSILIDNCVSMGDSYTFPIDYDMRFEGYNSKIDLYISNTIFNNTNMLNHEQTATSEDYPMRSYTLDNCKNMNTDESWFANGKIWKYITIKNCEFFGKLTISQANTAVWSFINNIFKELLTRGSKVIRVFDNMITTDVAYAQSQAESPKYVVKRGNLIIADTNTNQSSWND